MCALHGLDGRVDILVAQHERERSVLLAPMARHGRSACSTNGGEPARELRLRACGLPVALLREGLEVALLLGRERDAVEARACARTQPSTLACCQSTMRSALPAERRMSTRVLGTRSGLVRKTSIFVTAPLDRK